MTKKKNFNMIRYSSKQGYNCSCRETENKLYNAVYTFEFSSIFKHRSPVSILRYLSQRN